MSYPFTSYLMAAARGREGSGDRWLILPEPGFQDFSCQFSSVAAASMWRGPRIYESSALFTSERLIMAKGNGRIYLFDMDLLTLRVRTENPLSSRQETSLSQQWMELR